jgi:hypothetical protein
MAKAVMIALFPPTRRAVSNSCTAVREITSIVSDDEIDAVNEINFQVAMAHEIDQLNGHDRASFVRVALVQELAVRSCL